MREPNVIGAMVKASPIKRSTDGFRFHTLSRSTAKRALRAALEEAERMEYSEGGSSMYWLRKAIEPMEESMDRRELFTEEDVDDLRQVARDRRRQHIKAGHHHGEALAAAMENLADRILAALEDEGESPRIPTVGNEGESYV